jgi:hypothetical protein
MNDELKTAERLRPAPDVVSSLYETPGTRASKKLHFPDKETQISGRYRLLYFDISLVRV